MKIGINCGFALSNYPSYDEAFQVIKEAGFDCIDFPICDFWKKQKNIFLYEIDEYIKLFKDIKESLDRNGLIVSQTHAPFGLDKEEHFFTEEYENLIIRAIIASDILEAPYMVVHPIRMGCRYNYNRKKAFELNFLQLQRFIPYLKKYNIKIALENMYIVDPLRKSMFVSTMFSDAEETNRMIELLGDYFVACLDTGHALISSSEPIYDMTIKLGDNLKILHINDNNAILDDHNTPYSGKIDWQGFINALIKIGYDGVLNFELVIKDPIRFIPYKLKYIYELGKYLGEEIKNDKQ
ncbi:MAG: sugar phosphate isomerase/epimerase, partial [Bacilli bacterium]|nr:sugar phosphate isomerase/epimerase [Bacilli bacterium]